MRLWLKASTMSQFWLKISSRFISRNNLGFDRCLVVEMEMILTVKNMTIYEGNIKSKTWGADADTLDTKSVYFYSYSNSH